VVDIVREPILILDKDFKVIATNECFLKTFKVGEAETDGKNLYELGNGQWNNPELKKLLENILPKHTFFKGFEVKHDFPKIGKKIMILNGRQIHVNDKKAGTGSIILLAMEDVTDMMQVAELLANHANNIKSKMKIQVGKVEEEMSKLKNL
jgi:nitrogen-specific signal transduction histidine kinase